MCDGSFGRTRHKGQGATRTEQEPRSPGSRHTIYRILFHKSVSFELFSHLFSSPQQGRPSVVVKIRLLGFGLLAKISSYIFPQLRILADF